MRQHPQDVINYAPKLFLDAFVWRRALGFKQFKGAVKKQNPAEPTGASILILDLFIS